MVVPLASNSQLLSMGFTEVRLRKAFGGRIRVVLAEALMCQIPTSCLLGSH